LRGSSEGLLIQSVRTARGDGLSSERQPALIDRNRGSRLEQPDDCSVSFRGELPSRLGPVDKPRPDADATEQDETDEAGGELVISGGDAPLLLEMPNEALNP
jgi:hypothetical protein